MNFEKALKNEGVPAFLDIMERSALPVRNKRTWVWTKTKISPASLYSITSQPPFTNYQANNLKHLDDEEHQKR